MEPEYITKDNQNEFILWAFELKPTKVNADKFNMLLQINLEKWIYQNNVTWEYAYGNTLDTISAQQDIEKSIQKQQIKEAEEEQEKKDKLAKPTDKVKRRELFAKMAENRKKQ